MSALLNLGDKITAGNRADATFFYKKRVADDSGTLLTEAETDVNNRELLAQSLFDKASIVYTAGGVKAGTNYSVKGTDFTVTRAGVKNVIGRDGVLTEIPANTPATEFSGGVLKGTLIEPARTNLLQGARSLMMRIGLMLLAVQVLTPQEPLTLQSLPMVHRRLTVYFLTKGREWLRATFQHLEALIFLLRFNLTPVQYG
jgi:hypothetical protein